jgi:hypothetical protein
LDWFFFAYSLNQPNLNKSSIYAKCTSRRLAIPLRWTYAGVVLGALKQAFIGCEKPRRTLLSSLFGY